MLLGTDVINREEGEKKTTCKNVQSAFRCGLRVIYTGSPDLHDRRGDASPLIIVRTGILIWLFPISSVKGNKNHPHRPFSQTPSDVAWKLILNKFKD